MIFGALPIVGVFCWGWSAIEMFLFLLASLWVGIFCDLAKLTWLEKRAQAFADARIRDFQVWVVVDALRAAETSGGDANEPDVGETPGDDHQEETRPETAATDKTGWKRDDRIWQPWQGVFIDFVFGIISTVLIVGMLSIEIGVDIHAVTSRRLLLAIAALLVCRSFHTTWEIVRHRQSASHPNANPAADRPVKAAVGLRGTALFFLMFLVVFLCEETESDSDTIWIIAMTVVNGLVFLFGLLNATGWIGLRRETRWLRNYLQQHGVSEM